MKTLAERYSTQTIATGLVLAFIWLQSRVQSILPAVMQDEYIYSMQARKIPLADLEYPNYLYSLVFSSTNACGINYYSCAKNLNLVFFAGFVAIIFFLSRHFLGKWWAFGLSIATLLSPLGAYTSLFMPESMYFFFALLSVVVLWWAADRGLWWQYFIAGAAVGLTALVKPHALFLAAGAVMFLVAIHSKAWTKLGVAVGAYVGGTLATKFAIGLILAGPKGLTLFGSNYTSTLNNFTEDLRSSGAPESLSAGGAQMAAAAGGGNLIADFLGQTIFQIGWQSAAVFLLAGGWIAVVLGSLWRYESEDELGERRFGQLVLIMLGSMVLVIAAFAAMVTILGDDHSNRLLLRYYEFLIAPLAIGAIAVAKHSAKGNVVSWIAGGLTAVIGALGFLVWFPGLRPQFADSPIMMGVTFTEVSGGLAVALALGLGAAAFLTSRVRLLALGYLTIFSLVVFGFSSVNRLHAQASTISPIDSAGIFARDYLAGVEPSKIHFIGTNRQLTLASIFWLDKPDVQHTLVGPLTRVAENQVPDEVEWVVLLGGALLEEQPRFVLNGNGWSLANISQSSEHDFRQSMVTSPLSSTQGLGPITSWGRWLDANSASVSWNEPLDRGATIRLTVMVGESGAGQQLTITLGESAKNLELPQAGQIATVDIAFDNTQSETELFFQLSGSASNALALVTIEALN